MAPTLVASRTALPPEGPVSPWGGPAAKLAHPQASRTACRFATPLAGGNTCGPAKPVPRCS